MDTQLVRTTRQGELHSLALGGQPVILSHEQITRYLARTLSPAHAQLFAEPSLHTTRGTVDWYAPSGETPRRLAELDPAARADAEEKIRSRVDDIRRHAEGLQQQGGSSERLMGDMLLHALEVPSTDYVYAVNGEPLLVGWGHLLEGPGAPRGVLMRLVPSRPAAAAAATVLAPAVERRGLGWLWWLLGSLLLLLLLLAGTLVWQWPSIVAFLGLPGPSCSVSPAELAAMTTLDAERARGDALRQQIADAKAALAAHCAAQGGGGTGGAAPAAAPSARPNPPQQKSDAPPDTPKNPPQDDQKRVSEAGGKSGPVQITLAWDDENDLDLAIACAGGRIDFHPGSRQGCGGGELDLDANSVNGGRPVTRTPVEHVVWSGAPPPGTYKVLVSYYFRRAGATSPFRITIHQEGKPDKRIDGTIREGEKDKVAYEFTVP